MKISIANSDGKLFENSNEYTCLEINSLIMGWNINFPVHDVLIYSFYF